MSEASQDRGSTTSVFGDDVSAAAGRIRATRLESALDWAGLASHQALHLGDDPSLDVEAARRHGMRAVWVNRFGLAWPGTLPPPEAEIADLNQLWEHHFLELKT